MPKVKTKKIVTKRFKMTKTGKIFHRVQGEAFTQEKAKPDNAVRTDPKK